MDILIDLTIVSLMVFSAVFFFGVYVIVSGEKIEFVRLKWATADWPIFGAALVLCAGYLHWLNEIDFVRAVALGVVVAIGGVCFYKKSDQKASRLSGGMNGSQPRNGWLVFDLLFCKLNS